MASPVVRLVATRPDRRLAVLADSINASARAGEHDLLRHSHPPAAINLHAAIGGHQATLREIKVAARAP